MTTQRAKFGIIGCGNISGIYLKAHKTFNNLELVACADLDMDRARAKAAEHNIKAYSVDQLLADPEIEIVVNLTIPAAHAEVSTAAVQAGKAAYSEKPFALNRTDGEALLQAAAAKGVRVGCAPDTFLGGGLQTCRKVVDDGVIGEPVKSQFGYHIIQVLGRAEIPLNASQYRQAQDTAFTEWLAKIEEESKIETFDWQERVPPAPAGFGQ